MSEERENGYDPGPDIYVFIAQHLEQNDPWVSLYESRERAIEAAEHWVETFQLPWEVAERLPLKNDLIFAARTSTGDTLMVKESGMIYDSMFDEPVKTYDLQNILVDRTDTAD